MVLSDRFCVQSNRSFLFLLAVLFFLIDLTSTAHATLIVRGTDALGNQLIYDSDLNITWYDYRNPPSTWQNQVNWADTLSVNFGDTTYNDWRLPSTVDVEYSFSYIGSYYGVDPGGPNITSSEMDHLYYIELGNMSLLSGCTSGLNCGLVNYGPFRNLFPWWYRSGTEYSAYPGFAWSFNFFSGFQLAYSNRIGLSAMAVRDGDVVSAATPLPDLSVSDTNIIPIQVIEQTDINNDGRVDLVLGKPMVVRAHISIRNAEVLDPMQLVEVELNFQGSVLTKSQTVVNLLEGPVDFFFTPGGSGDSPIQITVDPRNLIHETNETNN